MCASCSSTAVLWAWQGAGTAGMNRTAQTISTFTLQAVWTSVQTGQLFHVQKIEIANKSNKFKIQMKQPNVPSTAADFTKYLNDTCMSGGPEKREM